MDHLLPPYNLHHVLEHEPSVVLTSGYGRQRQEHRIYRKSLDDLKQISQFIHLQGARHPDQQRSNRDNN